MNGVFKPNAKPSTLDLTAIRILLSMMALIFSTTLDLF